MSTLDKAEQRLHKAQQRLESAKSKLWYVLGWGFQTEIEKAQKAVNTARVSLDKAQKACEKLKKEGA